MESIYSAGPQNVPDDLVLPSSAYKRRAWLAMASLSLFLLLYVALAGWFSWTAYRTSIEAFVVGRFEFIFIAISSTFLALFMLKALFFVKKGSAPDAIEVTAQTQPRLFEYLNRLADEAGAPRPAKVYLSARVNAAVFYDLSILNLLFPSRKNLEIGLALVNVLTLSEIKAVLAHEFGHFAQRTMMIGSWVYIAHQIAAQIVAKRDKFDRLLQMLSNTDIRIAWVGWLLSLIVWSIRSLLDTALTLVLLAQRAMSRQMEFQADLVAVSLTGSNELVHALHKLQAADEAWERTLNFVDSELRAKRIPHDLFVVQTRIQEKVRKILADETYGQVPPVSAAAPQQHRVFKSSFAQPPQMWSTHPASADREENAKQQYLAAPHDERSAWLLFDRVDALKQEITSHLIGKTEAVKASEEDTLRELYKQYELMQYAPRYRGTYLGRSIVRHVSQVNELYQGALHVPDVQKALADLYSPAIATDLNRMRDLSQERATLEALRDKIYAATNGTIVFRGREISRRQLPAAIREVMEEENSVRQHVLAHDRLCRTTHLAAAGTLGGNWRKYLIGLIQVLHYAEHTLADLRDARGVLSNVVAIVLADGKVSKRERKRVVKTANMLHEVLSNIYKQKNELVLDTSLLKLMGGESWPALLKEFELGEATESNISDWMNAIDSWVDFTAGLLYKLSDVTLEQLLLSEARVEQFVKAGMARDVNIKPSRIPDDYPVLIPGNERKRQTRLGWWDSFQTASGLIPGLMRLAVAGAIVAGVLMMGSDVATKSELTVYNGLNRVIYVWVGEQKLVLQPNMATQAADIPLNKPLTIEAQTLQGETIERFETSQSGHVEHYVYNVAGASPLVQWTAVYGTAEKKPAKFLDAPRWTTAAVDHFFTEPPESVKTKGGSATRTVLEGINGRPAREVMDMLTKDEERIRVIKTHLRWDEQNSPRYQQWQQLAELISTTPAPATAKQ